MWNYHRVFKDAKYPETRNKTKMKYLILLIVLTWLLSCSASKYHRSTKAKPAKKIYLAYCLIIFIMIIPVSFAYSQVQNFTKYDAEKVAVTVCELLKMDAHIIITPLPSKYTSGKYRIMGLTTVNDDGSYTIGLKQNLKERYTEILIHELIHVYQFETKKLHVHGDKLIWYGFIEMSKKVKHAWTEPHEVEARQLTPLIIKAL